MSAIRWLFGLFLSWVGISGITGNGTLLLSMKPSLANAILYYLIAFGFLGLTLWGDRIRDNLQNKD